MIKTLSIDQSESLISYLRNQVMIYGGHHVRVRNYTMALLMLDAGLRVGELVQLRITDLWQLPMGNYDTPNTLGQPVQSLEIRPEISKGNRPRYIPLTHRVLGTIMDMYHEVWKDWGIAPAHFAFFASTPNRQMSTRRVQQIIKRAALASLGFPVHPHVLRHTFATRLMLKTNIRVVQELLGHKSLTSTQVYTHVNNQDCVEAIKKLEE